MLFIDGEDTGALKCMQPRKKYSFNKAFLQNSFCKSSRMGGLGKIDKFLKFPGGVMSMKLILFTKGEEKIFN